MKALRTTTPYTGAPRGLASSTAAKALARARWPLALAVLWAPLALVALGAQPAWAGEGHDHGGGPPAPSANGPQRLPDGSVFLPKPAQRQLGVRTLAVEAGAWPRSLVLNAQVVVDPAAGGLVQPLNAGRLEPGPRGLPHAGQAVRQGEVLAYVVPAVSPLERASQTAQLAEWRAAQALAEQRLQRLQALAGTVPRKDIEAARSEAASLATRAAALAAGLAQREVLQAPVSGVIAAAHAVAGQVVEAREKLFEVVDPRRLHIEALAHDPALPAQVAGATMAVGGHTLPLQFLGAARSLREQALPLRFRAQGAALAGLAVGQRVQVQVQTRDTVQGLRVPVSALVKNPANQTVVWVKLAPERFEPRSVSTEPLDGTQVVVTAGLKAGDRVAVAAATLINQVR